MQQLKLHKTYSHLHKTDTTDYSKIVFQRKKILADYQRLKNDGATEKVILSVLGISRSSYYRWKRDYTIYGSSGFEPTSTRPHSIRRPKWDKTIEEKVLAVRRSFLLFGKAKVSVILRREHGITLSCSTVGRILSSLRRKGLIRPASFYTGKYQPKPRAFNDHAQRLPKGLKTLIPGQLVQVDHMRIMLDDGKEVKHFQAICPITRFSVGQTHRIATQRAIQLPPFWIFCSDNFHLNSSQFRLMAEVSSWVISKELVKIVRLVYLFFLFGVGTYLDDSEKNQLRGIFNTWYASLPTQ